MNNEKYGYADTPALKDYLGLEKYFDGLSSIKKPPAIKKYSKTIVVIINA